jgi:hypothetical protein
MFKHSFALIFTLFISFTTAIPLFNDFVSAPGVRLFIKQFLAGQTIDPAPSNLICLAVARIAAGSPLSDDQLRGVIEFQLASDVTGMAGLEPFIFNQIRGASQQSIANLIQASRRCSHQFQTKPQPLF